MGSSLRRALIPANRAFISSTVFFAYLSLSVLIDLVLCVLYLGEDTNLGKMTAGTSVAQ